MFKPKMRSVGPIAISITAITTALFIVSCTHSQKHPHHTHLIQGVPTQSGEQRTPSTIKVDTKFGDRGSPAEYDPGAPKDSKWFELFGNVPNYRSVGIHVLGGKPMSDEKFRWQMGPMWYRGRLAPQSVKAFIVGQEGAQDENVSNRAFTGSTGTRVQKFLNHMGIYRSYLFMNTFVYTINGQLQDDPNFKWLEQGQNSPIVEYRHKLFDYMLETNNDTVALFMGVGTGGKASLATWINARGGHCSTAWELQNCVTTSMKGWFERKWEREGVLGPDGKPKKLRHEILAVGVPHPGGANPNLGGADQLQNIIRGFENAARRVAEMKLKNPEWLPKDPDEKLDEAQLIARMQSKFRYGHGSIPFRDFAFNTNWRMGQEGTTSNRWGADSIQVFSDRGTYNDKSSKFRKPRDLRSPMRADQQGPIEMRDDELAYEAPRTPDFDYGPCGHYTGDISTLCPLAQLLVSWPDLKSVGVTPISHESFGYFGTYRGRSENAKVIILADQTSHDDFFSTRALTGTDGQKLNRVLELAGIGQDYFILRTFPVDILGVDESTLKSGATHPAMLEHYKKIISEVRKTSPKAVLVSMGPVAEQVLAAMGEESAVNINLNSLSATNQAIRAISISLETDVKGEYSGELSNIPRVDLPYHTRWWMGTSGDRAGRGEGTSVGDYYRFWAPYWVEDLMPRPLSEEYKAELSQLQKVNLNKFYTPGSVK